MALEALIAFDALVVVVAGLAFLIGHLDAVDAAVARIDHVEIIGIAVGEGDAVGRVRPGAIDQAWDELLALRQRLARRKAPSDGRSDRDQCHALKTHRTLPSSCFAPGGSSSPPLSARLTLPSGERKRGESRT